MSRATETVSGESVTGEGPAEGFVLQLARVWDPLAS